MITLFVSPLFEKSTSGAGEYFEKVGIKKQARLIM